MIGCEGELKDPFRCPTKLEYLQSTLALLPRGRAWQSHEEQTQISLERFSEGVAECGEAECGEGQAGQSALETELSVMASYWCAYAGVLAQFSARVCDLLDEFFCQTASETRDVWGIDYGFPDPCDPWDDLCEKVAARGGATCEYLTWAAGRRGWTIDCSDCTRDGIGMQAGCGRAGCQRVCAPLCVANTVTISVRLADSPAYNELSFPARAVRMMAGCTRLCAPNTDQVRCLIDRIKPAHVQANYQFI